MLCTSSLSQIIQQHILLFYNIIMSVVHNILQVVTITQSVFKINQHYIQYLRVVFKQLLAMFSIISRFCSCLNGKKASSVSEREILSLCTQLILILTIVQLYGIHIVITYTLPAYRTRLTLIRQRKEWVTMRNST